MITPQEIAKKNDLGTGVFVLLNIITLGGYGLLRVMKMTDLIEGFSEQKICSRNFVIFLSVAYGFSFFGWEIVYFALLVYWSFLAKREIERYASQQMCISYEMNSFYTVVFNMYYINYCLNDLQEASEMCSLRNQNIREDGRSSQHCHKERVMEDANFFE